EKRMYPFGMTSLLCDLVRSCFSQIHLQLAYFAGHLILSYPFLYDTIEEIRVLVVCQTGQGLWKVLITLLTFYLLLHFPINYLVCMGLCQYLRWKTCRVSRGKEDLLVL